MVEQGEIQRTQNEAAQDMMTEEEKNPHKGAEDKKTQQSTAQSWSLNTTSE